MAQNYTEPNYRQKAPQSVFEKKLGENVDEINPCRWPGVNFINVLRAAFTCAGPKSAKEDSQVVSFLHFRDLRVQKLLVEF
jgi:hypothetical protein